MQYLITKPWAEANEFVLGLTNLIPYVEPVKVEGTETVEEVKKEKG